LRLELQVQLPPGQGLAQRSLQVEAPLRMGADLRRERLHLGPALGFRPVHRAVRVLQQVQRRHVGIVGVHQPDADARGDFSGSGQREQHVERVHDPIGKLAGFLGGHVGAQDDELVPPEPGDRVAVTDRLAQPLRRRDQQAVADGMPEAVVDNLELVEVQEKQRETTVRVDAVQGRLHHVEQGRSVRQSGQWIRAGRGFLPANLQRQPAHDQQEQ